MLIGYKIIICYAFYYSLPTPYFFSHAETAEPVMKTADHISDKIWLIGFEFLTAEIKALHRLVIPGKIILSFKEVILPYNNEKVQSWWVAFSFFRSLRFHLLVNYKRKFKSGFDQHRNLAEKKKMWKKAFEINGNNFDHTLKFIFQILSWLSVIHVLGVLLHVVFPRPFKMFVFLFLITALGLL